MIAFCGLTCTECPAYLATREDSAEKRAAVAEAWSKQFNIQVKPEDVNCDGCHSDGGRLMGYCSVCEIRKCGLAKAVDNCGYCDEYPCDRLGFIMDAVPDARSTLDSISKSR